MSKPEEVLAFWLEELEPKDWYRADDGIDARIRERFGATWDAAAKDTTYLDGWLATPEGALAALILLDQFSRNLYRGDPRAFSMDEKARAIAKKAIEMQWDLRIPEPQRQFFYTPLLHSECLCDQDRCVRLMKTRLPEAPDHLLHAQAHREVIRRFGRFPTRNAALGRSHSESERVFVEAAGGYGGVVNRLREVA